MNLPVVWSPVAKDEYADLLEFIENNYGVDAALRVLDKTEAVLESISRFPKMYPASSSQKDVRKAVLSKQTSLLYRVLPSEIQLLYFWDNRQNPERIEHLI